MNPWHCGTMQRITSHEELLRLSGGDPWVRWSLPDPLPGEAWVHQGIALVERMGWRRGFWVAPLRTSEARPHSPATFSPGPLSPGVVGDEAERVRAALLALRDGGHLRRLNSESVSVVQDHSAVAHEVLDLGDGGDWEWMWTRSAPPTQPAEAGIVELDDAADAAELTAFSRSHNPRVWTEIGTGRVRRWVGIRSGSGALLAVGGAEIEDSGTPHLAGIVTDSARRGAGLGTAVSAYLTRWALAEHGVCALGMFTDNAPARRIYERLGYRTARAWHSRTLRR